MQKILFQNAQIATSKTVFRGDLLVENGIIAQVGSVAALDNAKIIPCDGKFLLPGGVDCHTHFDLDLGFDRASDTFFTGTVAAACGGTTTVIDHMAFGPKGCNLDYQAKVYRKLAENAVIDYGLHGVIQHVTPDILHQMETMIVNWGITSYKVYLTYDFMLEDKDVLAVLQQAKKLGLVICVHCENNAAVTALRNQFVQEGKTQVCWHPESRPPESEAEAVFRMLMLAKVAQQANIYIVHLSSALGMEAIRLARKEGQKNIFAETCPQYLFLDDSVYQDDVEGLKYTISPPLRKKKDIETLWQAVENAEIDTIATDHCPFFFATQKQRGKDNFTLCPGGAPGVELRMALMFSQGVQKGRITLPEMVRLCCTNPAEIFGIAPQKGDIQPGADADLVVFDPSLQWTVTKSLLHENVDYTPYEGFQLMGKPVLTLSRGEIVAENGKFTGSPGRGRYLKRSPLQ